jgi:5-methylcytosine-specific restriction protein B
MHITPKLTRLIQQFWKVWETDPLIQQQRAEHHRRIARATELLQPERIPQLTRDEIMTLLKDTDNWHGLRWNKEEFWERVFGVADAQLPQLRQQLADLVQRADRGLSAEGFNTLKMIPGIGPGYLSEILALRFPNRYWLWNTQVRDFFTALRIDVKADLPQGKKSDEGEQYLAVGRRLDGVRQALSAGADRPVDYMLTDLFMYWANQQKDWEVGAEVSYWKFAPGENAWNWEACREGGFIAMGWDELGDLRDISREEFEQRCAAALQEHPEWKQSGLEQLWKFAHEIVVGDKIVANRGTSEILGIGTVTGPYEFVPNVQHGHHLPVEWEDLTPRTVNEGGWRKALVKLDRGKYETLIAAPPRSNGKKGNEPDELQSGKGYFSATTFKLLQSLHAEPQRAFYMAHKENFKTHVEEPFQRLMHDVAACLPAAITNLMETERNIFARILKNDFGQGGAWDHYWGAFYPQGGKRIADPQLSMWINHELLEFGFYIGDYGNASRQRFQKNAQEHYEALIELLEPHLSHANLVYGPHEDIIIADDGAVLTKTGMTWADWLRDPVRGGFDVSVVLPRAKVLHYTTGELVAEVIATYRRLFPLILLAAEDEPLPVILDYLDLAPGPEPDVVVTLQPDYPLEVCAEETGFSEEDLARWVRAIERKGQAILYGPPGTGKTYVAERLACHLIGGGDGFSDLVQFHPAYAYEDFIQGLRPQARKDGGLDYPLVPGRFLEFCAQATQRTGRCVLIIDEINRANLARVFGELMYLLEYRDSEIPLAGGRRLRIPPNVRIIGTMNTADRSIALVDHALRRRFAFLALYPNYEVLRRYHEKTGFPVESLIGKLKELNQHINDFHYQVGITFFLREDLTRTLPDIWQMEIEPYLEEYFFDQPSNVDKFRWANVNKDHQILS